MNMIRILIRVLLLLVPLTVMSQTTEDYFSRTGLNINTYHFNYYDVSSSSNSWTYTGTKTICIWQVFVFSYNGGLANRYIYIDGDKVYQIFTDCTFEIIFDFGLEPGEKMTGGFYDEYTVIGRNEITLANGEVRFLFDVEAPQGWRKSLIEGIGDTEGGLFPIDDFEGSDIFVCARDSTGMLWYNVAQLDKCDSLSCLQPRPLFSYVQNDFQVTLSNESEFATGYIWDFGNGDTSFEKNPVYNYPKAGCYSISLHASNECYEGKKTKTFILPLCITPDWDTIRKIDFLNTVSLKRINDHLQFLYSGTKLYRSGDDGASWQLISLPIGQYSHISDVEMYDDTRGILSCGLYGPADGNGLFITSDGGLTWQGRAPGALYLTRMVLGSHGEAWATGQYRYFRSLDFGETWTDLSDSLNFELSGIWNINDTLLIAHATEGIQPNVQYELVKSQDGGVHWQQYALPFSIRYVHPVAPDIFYGFGGINPGLYKTKDGGLTWGLIAPDISPVQMAFFDEVTGWVCDYNGIVYYTTDGMESFVKTNCSGTRIAPLNPISKDKVLAVTRNYIVQFNGIKESICLSSDQDNDGYSDDADCDDTNADIYPGALEIPNNDNDEDCDGTDLTTQVHDIGGKNIIIYPNPVSETLFISSDFEKEIIVKLYNVTGQLIYNQSGIKPIDITPFTTGIYFLEASILPDKHHVIEKIVILK